MPARPGQERSRAWRVPEQEVDAGMRGGVITKNRFTALIFAVRRDPVVAVRLAGLCKRVQVGAGPDPGVNASRRPATLVVLRDSERGVVDELLWIPDLPD